MPPFIRSRLDTVREEGFTLMEIVIAIIIFGILAAISLPIFLNAQKSVSSLDVKSGLVQAAGLVEQEKNDNDGLYPKYIPDELLQNGLWKSFAYTYSDDRLNYCLQGTDSNNVKWFVSNASSNTATSTDCTYPNIGQNSVQPWGTIITPPVNVASFTVNWPANSTTPTGAVTWSSVACPVGNIQYEVVVSDGTAGSNMSTADSGWITTNSYTPNLSGAIPNDVLTAKVRADCVTTISSAGSATQSYDHPGSYNGTSQNATVPVFPIAATSYASSGTPASYYSGSTLSTAATFNTLTCQAMPAGSGYTDTPYYSLSASQVNASGTTVTANVNSTNASPTLTLTNFSPDLQITYKGQASCVLTATVNGSTQTVGGSPYLSTTVTTNEYAAIQPTGTSNLTASSVNNPNVTPNQLNASTVSCAYGNLYYRFIETDSSGNQVAYTSPSGATTFGGTFTKNDGTNGDNMGSLNIGTTYYFHVDTYCKGTNTVSSTTSSPTLTVTAANNVPNTPGGINLTHNTVDPNQTQYLYITNPVTCGRGATAYYNLIQTQKSGYPQGNYNSSGWGTASSWNTSGWLDYQGAYYTYQAQVYCQNSAGTSGTTYSNSDQFIENIQAPPTVEPNNMWTNNYTTVYWNGVNCPAGTSPQYSPNQREQDGNWADRWFGWQNGTSTNVNGSGAQQQALAIDTRCSSNTISNFYSPESYNGDYIQWTVYQNPAVYQGLCGFGDTFSSYGCQINYNGGYPGVSSMQLSGQPSGLGIGQYGYISQYYTGTGPFNLYAIAYNASGNSGWQYLGSTTIQEYYMSQHDASFNWSTSSSLSFAPCTMGNGCSSSTLTYNNYAGSGIVKMNSSPSANSTQANGTCSKTGGKGACGIAVFPMKGLVVNHTYNASCYFYGSTTYITAFGLNANNGNGGWATRANSTKQTWYQLSQQFTPSSSNYNLYVDGSNSDVGSSSYHEWFIAGCAVTY